MNKQLGMLADIHYGKSPSEVLLEDGAYPIVGTGGIYGQARKAMFSSAVVVPRKGSLGNPQLIEIPFWPVDTTYAVLPKKNVNICWLYYCLLNFDLTKLNEATGVPSISRDWLSKVEFDDPGYSQQQKISDILSTIDETIAQTEALIQKYQQIKAGLMHDLFTRGITPDGQLRPPREEAPELYRNSAIGWIPREWTVKSVDEMRNPTKTITYGVLKPGSFVDGGVPLLQIEDVIHGDINYAKVHRISKQLDEEYSRTKVFGGEIVISLVGTIGKIALLPLGIERSNLHRNLGVISIDSIEIPHFFFYLLQSNKFQELLASATMGSTQSLLNLGSLRNMNVPIPSKIERSKISTILDSISKIIHKSEKDAKKLRQQKSGLMYDLLTGKVPVTISES